MPFAGTYSGVKLSRSFNFALSMIRKGSLPPKNGKKSAPPRD